MASLTGLDASVEHLLDALWQGHFADALRQVGVVQMEDFNVLTEQDFMEHIGMNLVEARKLSRKLASLPPAAPPDMVRTSSYNQSE